MENLKYIADIYFPAGPGQRSVFFWQDPTSDPFFFWQAPAGGQILPRTPWPALEMSPAGVRERLPGMYLPVISTSPSWAPRACVRVRARVCVRVCAYTGTHTCGIASFGMIVVSSSMANQLLARGGKMKFSLFTGVLSTRTSARCCHCAWYP